MNIIGLSTAYSTCRDCGRTISADSDGTVWDAVDELKRKRQLAGWVTRDGGHRCPKCSATLSQHQSDLGGKALSGHEDSGRVEDAPGDQGAAAAGRQSNGSDLATTCASRSSP